MSNNWKICEQESVHCLSNWKSKKDVKNNESQTVYYKIVDKQVQCPSIDNKGCQNLDFTDDRFNKSLKVQYDSNQLNLFLKKSVIIVENEILKSVKCWKKFSSWLKYWNDLEGNVKPLQKFTSSHLDQILNKKEKTNKYFISFATWNCSQTYLAVGYGAKYHHDWCTHDSFIFFWSLYERHQTDNKPEKILEIESCVSFIKAHFRHSSLYSVGTQSGKVIIVNTKFIESDRTEESYIRAVSSTHLHFHQEAIIGLEWLKFDKNNSWSGVISFGLDGKIIVWSFKENEKILEATAVYVIYIRDLPKTLGVREGLLSDTELAIVSFSFDPEDESNFIVGCQGGGIFKCCIEDLSHFKFKNFNSAKVEPKSPIVLAYSPHRTHVNCVQFSLKLRKIFVTSAADNELRIYNALQPKPLSLFHCDVNFLSTQWLFKTNAIVVVQEDGYLSVFSVTGDDCKIKQIQKFSLENQKKSEKIFVNNLGKDQVAIVSELNEVHLLSLKYF